MLYNLRGRMTSFQRHFAVVFRRELRIISAADSSRQNAVGACRRNADGLRRSLLTSKRRWGLNYPRYSSGASPNGALEPRKRRSNFFNSEFKTISKGVLNTVNCGRNAPARSAAKATDTPRWTPLHFSAFLIFSLF